MAKKESTFFNMAVTLFAVTFISSAALGYIYEITKGPKAATAFAKKIKAIQEVVPEFTNNPIEEQYVVESASGNLVFYPAKKNGESVGTAVETITNLGFSGTIKLMVGLLPSGGIYDDNIGTNQAREDDHGHRDEPYQGHHRNGSVCRPTHRRDRWQHHSEPAT